MLPFAGPAIAAVAVLWLDSGVGPTPSHGSASLLVSAAGLTAVIIAAALFLPWERLPADAQLGVPVLYLLVVGLVRHHGGGAASPYDVLIMLPLFFVALYGTPRQLAVTLAGVAATFLLPFTLIGPPKYPREELWRAILWPVVAGMVGLMVQRLVSTARARSGDLERLSEQMRSILNSAGEGIWGLDAGGRTVFVNATAAKLTGYSVEEMLVPSLHDLIHDRKPDGSPYPIDECPVHRSLHDGEIHQACDDVYWRKDGSSFPVEYTATPIRDRSGIAGAVVVFRDVTERSKIERMKDEFISVVSHELRTPLTSIRGSLGLVGAGVTGPLPAAAQRMVDIAVTNTDRLVRLINDILDIERIESGKATMEPQAWEATELIEQAASTFELAAAEAGVELSVSPAPARVWADRDRILQTLINLLSNALKFSPRGTTVRLTAESRADEVVLRVADEGRGIPAEKLASVFQRFEQVDSSDSREKGGTGLGLAICRSIVEQHGGDIWVESGLGRGSTFSFTLPEPEPPAAHPQGTGGRGAAAVGADV